MKRLITLLIGSDHTHKSTMQIIINQIIGFAYLLSHPIQLRRIIIRETQFGQRYQSKRDWVDWQKYNSLSVEAHNSTEAQACPLNVQRIQTIIDIVARLGNGLKVLDVGCGNGAISEHVLKMGNCVMSVDLPKIVDLARNRRVLSVISGDAEQLPFPSNIIDLVLASEVVEHLWNPHDFLAEAYRVLGTDGHLIVSTPEGREGLRYDSHKYSFTVEGLKQILAGRFTLCEIKRLNPIGTPTPTVILLLRKSRIAENE